MRASRRWQESCQSPRVSPLCHFLRSWSASHSINQATPLILGLPLLLAWLLLWIIATSGIMAVIYLADPANQTPDP